MAQIANIVINDGATTPVAHTFKPIGSPNGGAFNFWVERPNGKAEFQREVRARTIQPASATKPNKVDLTILVPQTDTVAGVETLVSMDRVDVTFTLSPLSSTQARKDLRSYLRNLLEDSQVVAMVDGLENAF